MQVLIVDDEVFKRIAIKRALEEFCPARTDFATTVEEALQRVGEQPYDLILSDMNYPLKRGEPNTWNAGEILVKRLRERGLLVPVIICSSENVTGTAATGSVWFHPERILSWDLQRVMREKKIL